MDDGVAEDRVMDGEDVDDGVVDNGRRGQWVPRAIGPHAIWPRAIGIDTSGAADGGAMNDRAADNACRRRWRR